MLLGFILAALLGVVWLNVLVLFGFKTGFIYKYITRKGEIRDTFEEKSNRWLVLLGMVTMFYLLISDFLVLGYNDHKFITVFLLNVLLMAGLLSYNAFVINHWLLVVVRPMMLNISKMMTPITIRSYTRYTLIQGGTAALLIGMLSGWLYQWINVLVR